MNGKTMFRMTALVSAAAALTLSSQAVGDTLGCWLLNGEVGAATYGTIPNLVSGSSLSLELGCSDASGTWTTTPTYKALSTLTGDQVLAETSVYSDLAMTNRLAALTTCLCLQTKGTSTANDLKSSHYLRIPEFGTLLAGKDFTVEVIMQVPMWNGYNNTIAEARKDAPVVGISTDGDGEPAFWLMTYNYGGVRYKGTTAYQQITSPTKWLNYAATTGTMWFEKNIWHHFAFQYSVSAKKMTIVKDYTESTFEATMTGDGATGLPMSAGAFLQILGSMGTQCPYGTPNSNVLAVRVSSGILDYTKFMTLSRGPEGYSEDPVVGWWRMESGTLGASLSVNATATKDQRIYNERSVQFANKDNALASEKSYGGFQNGGKTVHAGVSAVFAAPRKDMTSETASREASVCHTNALVLASSQYAEAVNGLRLYVPRVPDMGIPGSFTCEAFVRKDLEASLSGVGQARGLLMGGTSWGVWDNKDFGLAFYYIKTIDGVPQTIIRPQMTMATQIPADHKWHHVAIVYDRPSASGQKKLHLYYDYKETAGSPVTLNANEDLRWNSDGKLRFVGSTGVQGSDSWWDAGDELRFTRAALTPSQFLHSYSSKGLMIVIK